MRQCWVRRSSTCIMMLTAFHSCALFIANHWWRVYRIRFPLGPNLKYTELTRTQPSVTVSNAALKFLSLHFPILWLQTISCLVFWLHRSVWANYSVSAPAASNMCQKLLQGKNTRSRKWIDLCPFDPLFIDLSCRRFCPFTEPIEPNQLPRESRPNQIGLQTLAENSTCCILVKDYATYFILACVIFPLAQITAVSINPNHRKRYVRRCPKST